MSFRLCPSSDIEQKLDVTFVRPSILRTNTVRDTIREYWIKPFRKNGRRRPALGYPLLGTFCPYAQRDEGEDHH